MTNMCKSIGCNGISESNNDFCSECLRLINSNADYLEEPINSRSNLDKRLDVYLVNHLFNVQDSSGCLQQAISKLLLASSKPSMLQDVIEARNTLNRWLEINT